MSFGLNGSRGKYASHGAIARTLIAAGTVLGLSGLALAGARETASYTNVPSKGLLNAATNETRSVVLTGGYPVRSIRITGTLRTDVVSNQSEAQLLVTPPTGAPFLVQVSRVRVPGFGNTGEPAGSTFTYTDYVFPLNAPISDAAGTWTFRFFERVASGGAGSDATWTSIDITMDDTFSLPATTQSLTPAAGVFTEMEPNDDSFLTPNVIAGMAPGDSIVGTTSGGSVYPIPGMAGTGALDTADNFVMSTTPAPLGIYRYDLTINSSGPGTWPGGGLMGTTQNSVFPTVGLPLVGGGKGAIPSDRPDAFGVHGGTRIGSAFYTAWYAFGKGEHVSLRISGAGNPDATSYTATLGRVPVTPEVISTPIAVGATTISSPDSAGGFKGWIYDANFEPLTHITVTGGFPAKAVLTTTLTPGTYYLGTSDFFTNNQAQGVVRNLEGIHAYPGVASALGQAFPVAVNFIFNEGTPNEVAVPAIKENMFDIQWFKFTVGSPCAADFNGDSVRDVADLFAYINAWLAKTPNANFNGDGAVDVADLFAYINAWLAGC